LGLHVRVVVAERSDPRHNREDAFTGLLRRLLYLLADAVVVQTHSVREWAVSFIPKRHVSVIPNPVMAPVNSESSKTPLLLPDRFILAVGRLVPVKGFDLLLQSFAACSCREHLFLVILGDGPERQPLETLARQLGVIDRLIMPGAVQDISCALVRATLFVLSSRYEGFPNVLLEAMSCGCPVVSFDCPSGPREIICPGIDGVLVPAEDVKRLSAEIDRLADDAPTRRQLGANARHAVDRFSIDKILAMWDRLLVGPAD
jgi:glycosyltransferase involved in cell wall biosynthesis